MGRKESLIPDVILELDFLALEAVLNIEISLLSVSKGFQEVLKNARICHKEDWI